VQQAQRAVVAAQHALDKAVATQDSAVKQLVTACAATTETTPITSSVQPAGDNSITGAAGASPVVVTLRTAGGDVATTTAANPQRVGGGGTYAFTGLTAGTTYTLAVVRAAAVNSDDCATAVTAVTDGQHDVDTDLSGLDRSLDALTRAVAALTASSGSSSGGTGSGSGSGGTGGSGGSGSGSGSGGSGSGSPAGSGAGGTGSGTTTRSGAGTAGTGTGSGGGTGGGGTGGTGTGGSGSSTGGSTAGTTITAAQIAADTKTVDADQAALAVAQHDVGDATLTTPLAGTVAAVSMAKGDTVSASSSTETVTVVGTGALSVELSIGLSDIDLVKAGQAASVTVDGHSTPLPAKVTYVGVLNSASSTGTSSAYTVTVTLDTVDRALYDGMGADVAIAVGAARNVLTVPLSAVHTFGTRHTVTVDAGGNTTTAPVGIGVVGASVVQVTSGLHAGQRVVLADLGAAVPSSTSTTTTTRRFGGTGGSFGGLSGGTGAGGGPGFRPGG
jgi:hypothetical protein